MGLYFLLYQEIQEPSQFCGPESGSGDHDLTFYGCVFKVGDPALSQKGHSGHWGYGGKNNENANRIALEKVRLDKEREAKNGHDGTWVAHPDLVAVAMEEFNKYMPTPNQMHVSRDDVKITAEDLVEIPLGTVTESGVRKNINVGILYTEAWLRGYGAVALYNLMEDAATAEISRTQVWQWLKNEVKLDDGRTFNLELCHKIFDDEVEKIIKEVGEQNMVNTKFELAIDLFRKLITAEEFEEFLTLSAYNYI